VSDAHKAVALVTGAARGMGADVALRLAQDGYVLAVADVRSCRQTADDIGAAGGTATPYECDIRDWSAVEELVAAVERDQGPSARRCRWRASTETCTSSTSIPKPGGWCST
jgi:NAD(P)-dependent dehydrogenase (short-subunit alcohol dehydrogenase family)